jgi:hypothetical protein
LSCLKGNLHEQFFGGGVGVIPLGYPADEETGRKTLRLVLTQLPRMIEAIRPLKWTDIVR